MGKPGAWDKGSTRAYRQARTTVLNRDHWTCQLCGKPIPRNRRFPHPQSATAHHLKGKRYGDNPADMVAAHLECNLEVGDPTRSRDPKPTSRTRW